MNFETILSLFMKKYFIATVATMFGALAHSFESIKKNGWTGWFSFLSDMIMCSFTGFTFFHLAPIIFPDSQQALIICTSLGSYWGTKGFVLIREWFTNAIKANIR
jgi:hypothetical protein